MFTLRGFAEDGGDAVDTDFHGFFNVPFVAVDVFGGCYRHVEGIGSKGQFLDALGDEGAVFFGEVGYFTGSQGAFAVKEEDFVFGLVAQDFYVLEFFFREVKGGV